MTCGCPSTNAPGAAHCDLPANHNGLHSISGYTLWDRTTDRRGAARDMILHEWRFLTEEDKREVLAALGESQPPDA